jgi:hypothetical protein
MSDSAAPTLAHSDGSSCISIDRFHMVARPGAYVTWHLGPGARFDWCEVIIGLYDTNIGKTTASQSYDCATDLANYKSTYYGPSYPDCRGAFRYLDPHTYRADVHWIVAGAYLNGVYYSSLVSNVVSSPLDDC